MKTVLIIGLLACFACLGTALPNQLDASVIPTSGENWNGTIWALLVAGSNGYENYRHQADVCHAYHVLVNHGIKKENIVTMMYDDIAHADENPHPGTIINKPGGRNVYPGVSKDYTLEDVNPQMFLKVLQGDAGLKSSGRRVIESGPKDHVFVYFADHGADNLIAFPSDELYAADLNKVLKKMSKEKKFDKLVFYLEACESGSMFEKKLANNERIFATTAANSEESSYACYWSDEYGAYLGDLYSVNWIEESEKHRSLRNETLEQEFKIVKKETDLSHVQQFGDLTIANSVLGDYQGEKESQVPYDFVEGQQHPSMDAIPSRDVPLMTAKNKLRTARSGAERAKLGKQIREMIEGRSFLRQAMERIATSLGEIAQETFDKIWNRKKTVQEHECYKELVQWFDEHCFDLSTHPYSLGYLHVMANFCDQASKPELSLETAKERAKGALQSFCIQSASRHPFKNIR